MNPIQDIRTQYKQFTLDERDAPLNPFQLFSSWWDQAIASQIAEPNAMTLATSGIDGQPHARIVLLKGFNEEGFEFFTNYESDKARELEQNPHASLLFFWQPLERQIRIEGKVRKTSDERSTEYFQSRPLGSQTGAWASPQSREILDRQF